MVLTGVAVLLADRSPARGAVPPRPRLAGSDVDTRWSGPPSASTVVPRRPRPRSGPGGVVAVLGPSGSGKGRRCSEPSPGLQPLDDGRVLLGGRDLAGVPPHARGVGLMFKDHALFPHRDVGANVGFGLRMQRRPAPEVAARVAELLSSSTSPASTTVIQTLSGGAAAGALARALAPNPECSCSTSPSERDRTLRTGSCRAARAVHEARAHGRRRHPRPGRGVRAGDRDRRDGPWRDTAGRSTPEVWANQPPSRSESWVPEHRRQRQSTVDAHTPWGGIRVEAPDGDRTGPRPATGVRLGDEGVPARCPPARSP